MANSLLRPVFFAAVLLLAAVVALPAETCNQGIVLNSTGGVEADLRTGKAIMQNVSISQCNVSIVANRAEASGGLDTKNSRWLFTGDVKVTSPQSGRIQSDQADVEFRNDRILRATIKGTPAQFEQKQRGSADLARGRAGTIVYEVAAGTVTFADNAWLSNGKTQISAPRLVYDMSSEKVRAITAPGGEQRVQITTVPRKTPGAEPTTPPPAPQPEPSPDGSGETAR